MIDYNEIINQVMGRLPESHKKLGMKLLEKAKNGNLEIEDIMAFGGNMEGVGELCNLHKSNQEDVKLKSESLKSKING